MSGSWGDANASAAATDVDFATFFRAEFKAVTRSAYLILQDEDAAEDIAQDAFMQLHRHWTKVSAYERPDAWVRRVAIRLAVRSLWRRRMLRVLIGRIEPPDAEETRFEADPDLAAALGRLPTQQRAAVVLHYYEDRPLTEVARILGCSHATAKVHVFKARRKLALLLDPLPKGADRAD